MLCYATSIHKSQGSEYPVVVIPVSTQHYMMLKRNLIYTGITRGKRLVVLVGQKRALAIAVKGKQVGTSLVEARRMVISLIRACQCKRCLQAVFGQLWRHTPACFSRRRGDSRRLHCQAIRKSIYSRSSLSCPFCDAPRSDRRLAVSIAQHKTKSTAKYECPLDGDRP